MDLNVFVSEKFIKQQTVHTHNFVCFINLVCMGVMLYSRIVHRSDLL